MDGHYLISDTFGPASFFVVKPNRAGRSVFAVQFRVAACQTSWTKEDLVLLADKVCITIRMVEAFSHGFGLLPAMTFRAEGASGDDCKCSTLKPRQSGASKFEDWGRVVKGPLEGSSRSYLPNPKSRRQRDVVQ